MNLWALGYNGFHFFDKIKSPDHSWMQNWILRHIYRIKGEKVHNFYTFMPRILLWELFYTFFNGFEISIKFCVICTYIKMLWKKYFWCQLWSLTRTKRLKEKISFFRCESDINYIFQFWFRTSKVLKSFHSSEHTLFYTFYTAIQKNKHKNQFNHSHQLFKIQVFYFLEMYPPAIHL